MLQKNPYELFGQPNPIYISYMYVCIYLYVYITYGTEWLSAKEMPLYCGAEEDS